MAEGGRGDVALAAGSPERSRSVHRLGRRLRTQGHAVQCSGCFLHISPLKCDGTCMSSESDQLMWCNTSEGDRSSPSAHYKLN